MYGSPNVWAIFSLNHKGNFTPPYSPVLETHTNLRSLMESRLQISKKNLKDFDGLYVAPSRLELTLQPKKVSEETLDEFLADCRHHRFHIQSGDVEYYVTRVKLYGDRDSITEW